MNFTVFPRSKKDRYYALQPLLAVLVTVGFVMFCLSLKDSEIELVEGDITYVSETVTPCGEYECWTIKLNDFEAGKNRELATPVLVDVGDNMRFGELEPNIYSPYTPSALPDVLLLVFVPLLAFWVILSCRISFTVIRDTVRKNRRAVEHAANRFTDQYWDTQRI